jgi:hypothetical protein
MKEQHYCDIPFESKEYAYGMAITECYEEEDGTLTSSNGEYANQVNFCPICGYEAKVKIENK